MTKPNPENCKNCSSKCAYDCVKALKDVITILNNTTQNSSDNLLSYLQTNIIAQMLSIEGEGESADSNTNDLTAQMVKQSYCLNDSEVRLTGAVTNLDL